MQQNKFVCTVMYMIHSDAKHNSQYNIHSKLSTEY